MIALKKEKVISHFWSFLHWVERDAIRLAHSCVVHAPVSLYLHPLG